MLDKKQAGTEMAIIRIIPAAVIPVIMAMAETAIIMAGRTAITEMETPEITETA